MADVFNTTRLKSIADSLIASVIDAGAEIMRIHKHGASANFKADASPVTEADKRAEEILVQSIDALQLDIPVISEENAESHVLKPKRQYFLVDPLDGTKEYLDPDGQGNFTVNVALVQDNTPTMGIILAPALNQLYVGVVGSGTTLNDQPVSKKPAHHEQLTALASRKHRDQETNTWLREHDVVRIRSVGSSIKFGMLACGEADVYPRFAPTMEWDTAAGQAILTAAGGSVSHPDGQPFHYGKPGYRNTPFIARAPGT